MLPSNMFQPLKKFFRIGIFSSNIKNTFATSETWLGRSPYSYVKKRRSIPNMDIPKYLKDGLVRRGLGRSGRNNTGRVTIRHRGGGHPQTYRIIDFVRAPLEDETTNTVAIKDKILQIGYDPCRSARIALCAGNGDTRQKLLVVPDGVAVGDILTASRGPPESISRIKPGDAYTLGELPVGSIVYNVELQPGKGAQLARAAGTSVQLIRKTDEHAVILLPSKKEKSVNINCLATVGRASNVDHKHEIIGKAGRACWLGKRPKGKTGKDRWLWTKKRV
ncbi:39S ribosomal protein L2, mitochondrial-like [Xenia sp. Carnegie-2017]|uniref:39S ribosomal protein L2, mitochondrial-like n=1 Tax=Xenia sp. Carnegie-2017 TaxID=2897299 RepID=UPI001F04182A|nr:39S ribosomal protein L2, mitochondrial-like [Xenia sp. Carnegie-2017]